MVLQSTENIRLSSSSAVKSPTGASRASEKSNSGKYPKATTFECNFDKNPTKLYLSIQHKRWGEVSNRAKTHPQESKTWVSRYEEDGRLRWRLLPLHAAIIFRAPESTIQTLLLSYPRAARHKDDQEMLPIHLAIRNESTVAVLQLLLMSFPGAMEAKDRKGRTPLVFVKNSHNSLRDGYMEALSLAEGLHAIASASLESNAIHNLRKKAAVGKLECDAEKINLMAKIDAMELQLSETQASHQIMTNHASNLEDQLASSIDSENMMSSKVTSIETTLKEVMEAKELAETEFEQEKTRLLEENEQLKAERDDLTSTILGAKETSTSVAETLETEISSRNIELEAKMKEMEKENADQKAELQSMEELLKKKTESEESIANQVSDLATRLAESTAGTCAAAAAFQKRIGTLVEEKAHLKKTVELLTVKVQSVMSTLDFMTKEHDRILKLSEMYQETIANAQRNQATLEANAARNEQMMLDAALEREQIRQILTRQLKEKEHFSSIQDSLMDLVRQQSGQMDEVAAGRGELHGAIKTQQSFVSSLRKDIDDLRLATSDDLSFNSNYVEDATITPTIVENETRQKERDGNRINDGNTNRHEIINEQSIDDEDEDGDDDDDDDDDEIDCDGTDDDDMEHDTTFDNIEANLHLLNSSSTLTSSSDDELLVDDEIFESDSEGESDDEVTRIETTVDALCIEAAELVAAIPSKKK